MKKIVLSLFLAVTAGGCFSHPPAGLEPDAGPDIHQSIFRGLILSHQTVNGYALAEGDMILGESDRMEAVTSDQIDQRNALLASGAPSTGSDLIAINGDSYRWTGGVVPYVISSNFPYTSSVNAAIAHWNAQLNGVIQFVPRTNQADYLVFTTSTACASYIGKVGGPQAVWVAQSCTAGNIIHELGHALGAFHEQNRIDRDQYVKIHWENIQPALVGEFEKTGNTQGTDLGSYDFASIMHYAATADSANGGVTIETIPPGIAIGQRDGLSPGDIADFTALYGGGTTAPPPPVQVIAPTVITQPQDASVQVGGSATFTVAVTGTSPFTYQWFKDGLTLTGETGTSLSLTNIQQTQGGDYWARISNSAGTAESQHALLSVAVSTPPPVTGNGTLTNGIPVILSGAQNQQLLYTFNVPAGATNLSFVMSGGTGDADLYVRYAQAPTLSAYDCRPFIVGNNEYCTNWHPQAGVYYVLINGYTDFASAQLIASYQSGPTTPPPPVIQPPVIYTQPQSVSVQVGSSAYFWVSASGTGSLSYQWYKDGQVLPGQVGSSLSLTNVQSYQAGLYDVVVGNAGGSVTSGSAQLSVTTPPPPPPPPPVNVITPLTPNVPVGGLSAGANQDLQFSLQVPAGVSLLSIRTTGGSGDADLWVRYGAPPSLGIWDCDSNGNTNEEFCSDQYPVPGTYYITVHGYSGFSGLTLVASFSSQPVTYPTQQSISLAVQFHPPRYGDPFSGYATLTWTPANGVDYYAIYRNGLWVGTTYGLSYEDDFIPSNYQASYQVFGIFAQQRVASSNIVLLSQGWPY